MTDEPTHIATAAAALDDPYAALSKRLHGDGDAPPLRITYRNWRGEVSERNIVPQSVWFGATEWHPEPQWLLSALDTDKGAARDFALADFGANDDTWRTRALAAEAEVERLRGLTTEAIQLVENCSVETGICCCGDNMEGHPSPMNCGHTPTDMGAYRALRWLDAARAALAEGGPDDR